MLSVIIEVKNPILQLGSSFANILAYKKLKRPCHLVWLVQGVSQCIMQLQMVENNRING